MTKWNLPSKGTSLVECPICNLELNREFYEKVIVFRCPGCGGRLVTISGLRNLSGNRALVDLLWRTAQYGDSKTGPLCTSCQKPMRRVTLPVAGMPLELDVCCTCQTVWFDPSELEQIPLPEPKKVDELPPQARELLALRQIQLEEERINREVGSVSSEAAAPD